ncbi:MAG: molecular chaperone DnaK [Synergistetes bacterium]|nr:molecular chaperone DnaK [Synergistota bacterium]
MNKVVGIDFGTTYSAIAFMAGERPEIIPNRRGRRVTPSIVAFSKNGEILVGEPAKNQAILNPERTISSIKRYMGTNYKVEIDGKEFRPQDIAALIIRKLKEDAEEFLGERLTEAVITVPAYFSDSQRQATKEAGELAGLKVLRIINEPTAAALAYGLGRNRDKGELRVLVFDLGGGTFDVSILEIAEGVFEVKATSGDNRLGGDDFDERLMDYLIEQFKRETGIDLSQDKMALQKLKEEAERAKIELSDVYETEINIPFIAADETGPKHLLFSLKRDLFEDLIGDIVERVEEPVLQALEDASLSPEDIDQVLLVGGSTRVPLVQRKVKELLGKDPLRGVNPDECVALGAAIQAAMIKGEVTGIVLVDVTPLSLGVETVGGIFTKIIERNTPIPTSASRIFTTVADNQTTVEIHVLQGERPIAEENISLGRFQLTGIRPAPKGVPRIEVTFSIDVDGIVHVKAKDLDTGKEQKIEIKGIKEVPPDEVEKIIREAELERSKDESEYRLRQLRSQVQSVIDSLEKRANFLEYKDSKRVKEVLISLRDKISFSSEEELRETLKLLEELEEELERSED